MGCDMIEQLSTAVKFVAFFTLTKQGVTGLTVTVDVYNAAGTLIVTAAAATEIGGGLYSYTLASGSTGTEGLYLAIFKTAGDADQQHIPSLWAIGVAGVERLDAAVSSRNATTPPTAAALADAVWDEGIAGHATAGSTGQALTAAGAASNPLLDQVPGAYASGTAGAALGRIGSGQIATVAPVGQGGIVTLIPGDDYKTADGRALEWTDTNAGWPDLNGTIAFVCGAVSAAGSIITATGAGKKVRVQLTAAETTALPQLLTAYAVRMTQSDGDVITLAQGQMKPY